VNFLDTLHMAVSAIFRNKIRSFLTALGIVIGVASVIAMVHLGQAATMSVTERISSMGSNMLMVRPGAERRGRGGTRSSAEPFTTKDVDALVREVDGVLVAPTQGTNATLVYGNTNHSASVTGTTNEFLQIRNREIASGRAFEEVELDTGAAVCLLGKTVVDTLYGVDNPLGTSLRVGRTACQVVGVLAEKGGSFGGDEDDVVLMPIKAVQQRMLGVRDISMIYISAVEDGTSARVKADIESLLRQRRSKGGRGEDDFNVRDMQEIADTLEGTTKTLTALLAAIAAVSLLVGGIGIMNIMLVSVTERTREIGIRLAIGARARDVMTQFLVEAIALSTLGGLLGVALGIGGTWFATDKLNMPFVLSPETMLVGFSFSVIIGVIFGYVPARKAAHLNPIEALRHE
jgi:putative ABC transport system permease protein